MERCIVPIQSRAVAMISEYTPPSDPLAAIQTDPYAKIDTENPLDIHNRKPLSRVAKCLAIMPNTEASVSVTNSMARSIHMAPHPNLMRNWMILVTTEMVSALLHVSRSIKLACFA